MKLFLFLFLFVTSVSANELIGIYENSVSKKPYVEFLAREAGATSPGHAFVAIGEELDNGLLFQKGVFGFYPKSNKLVDLRALYSIDGIIDFRLEDINPDFRYHVVIDDTQMKKIESVLKRWKDKKYSLFAENCSKLAAEVAEAIGLKLPSKSPGATLPLSYMKALKATN